MENFFTSFGYRQLQNQFNFIDKDRTGIWGWSYGGYVTAMALAMDTAQPPVFSCGMSVAPVTNWLLYGENDDTKGIY